MRSMALSESWRRLWRKLERCDCPKPVCRARRETLTVPVFILRNNSRRRRSCICEKFICGNFTSSNGPKWSAFSESNAICRHSPLFAVARAVCELAGAGEKQEYIDAREAEF